MTTKEDVQKENSERVMIESEIIERILSPTNLKLEIEQFTGRAIAFLGPEVGEIHYLSESSQQKLEGYTVFQLTENCKIWGQIFPTDCRVESLRLWGTIVDEDSISSLKELRNLKLLDLTTFGFLVGGIGDKGARGLSSLKGLTDLNLTRNSIGSEGLDGLASLNNLVNLNLSENLLGDQGVAKLSKLVSLRSLNLSSNSIKNLDDLANLTTLNSLNLAYNLLGDQGALALSTLAKLTELNLKDNKIGEMGARALSKLTSLTSLNLSRCPIGEKGAKELCALTNLETLVLSNTNVGSNALRKLSTLPSLTNFDFSENSIGVNRLRELSAFKKLTNLYLSRCKINTANLCKLKTLTNLTTLDLGFCGLGSEAVRTLAELTKLSNLRLKCNNIGDEGAKKLVKLVELRNLDLSQNNITDKSTLEISTLTSLIYLNLANNKVGDKGAHQLASLPNLISLNLENNKVTDLHQFVPMLRQGMGIRSIAAGLGAEWYDGYRMGRAHGIGLIVLGCPIKNPPPEVTKSGRKAILNYFEELEHQGSDLLFEAKVLILGEGRAGKTSLIKRLYLTQEPLPTEDETTKGINIHRHVFSNTEGRDFRLNVWDFGGQQIYHATHQFFLTKNSLYILVDDTAKDSKSVHDEGFKYWLEVIEAFSEKSPVLIFQNEKGGRAKTIDISGIKGKFTNVKDVYRGDLIDHKSVSDISEAIQYYVQQLPHIGEKVPAKWVVIRAELEKLAKERPYISQQEYFDIYSQSLEFDREKALLLSCYLHDLGVFLHFQEERQLARTVILQNSWATVAVFRILDDETIIQAFGRFTSTDCDRVWQDSRYVDMHAELLALMEKFELCYRLADARTETWLAPQLLSPSVPDYFSEWNDPGDLVLNYLYEFLPKGVVSRLMVRMNRFALRYDLAWSHGVFFEKNGTEVLVRQTLCDNEIQLRARGPEAKALLCVIASDLDALNHSFSGLEDRVHKLVPCICETCSNSTSPHMFKEEKLLERKAAKKDTIECAKKPYSYVSVLALLDGIWVEHLPDWSDLKVTSPGPAHHQDDIEINIFLASSSEMSEDRDAFDLFFRQENDRLKKEGLYLKIIRWENFLDSMSKTRKQDDYNVAIGTCDIFVSLFQTKTGMYTEEEFEVAHKSFMETGKPHIFTFFKESKVSTSFSNRESLQSLWDFQERLDEMGHFYTIFKNTEDLMLKFYRQLERLKESGKI